jgi:hypothetical protein
MIKATIGGEAEIVLTSSGQRIELRDGETRCDVMAFKLQAPRASGDAARADVLRRGNETPTLKSAVRCPVRQASR